MTFVASTGDYGAADPEYPAFSPNVVAVGGTSLTLNADGSYNSETGWGYLLGFRGHVHRFRRRDQPVRAGAGVPTGRAVHGHANHARRLPGRRSGHGGLDRRPATTWIPATPSRSWAARACRHPPGPGCLRWSTRGAPAAGESPLNSSTPNGRPASAVQPAAKRLQLDRQRQQRVYRRAGYNLVTGLGTPVANLLVPDLVAYHGPGTSYGGPTVGPLQNANLVNTGASGSGTIDVFSVFDYLTVAGNGPGDAEGQLAGADVSSSPRFEMLGLAVAGRTEANSPIAAGPATNLSAGGVMPLPPAGATVAAASSGVVSRVCTLNVLSRAVGLDAERPSPAPPRRAWERGSNELGPVLVGDRTARVTDSVLDELFFDPMVRDGEHAVQVVPEAIAALDLAWAEVADPAIPAGPLPRQSRRPTRG